MAQVICPNCSSGIPDRDLNIAGDVALCRACGELSRLSEIVDANPALDANVPVDVEQPPTGCVIEDLGGQVRVIASARSLRTALGLFMATLFWNGIVFAFVVVAAAGTWYHLFGAMPSWFPPMTFNGRSTPSLGFVIFLWIFLLPFITVGLGLTATLLTVLLGRCEVRLRGREGVIFTGFGPIGWRRRFDASAVESVRLGWAMMSHNDKRQSCVVISADRERRLGSILTRPRQAWMRFVLAELLGCS